LTVTVIKAELTRDTEMFGSMDPYVRMSSTFGNHKTSVNKKGGKKPMWKESFIFRVRSMNDTIEFSVED